MNAIQFKLNYSTQHFEAIKIYLTMFKTFNPVDIVQQLGQNMNGAAWSHE